MPAPTFTSAAPAGVHGVELPADVGLPPAGYDGSEQQAQDLAALERCERLNECWFCVRGEIDGRRLRGG